MSSFKRFSTIMKHDKIGVGRMEEAMKTAIVYYSNLYHHTLKVDSPYLDQRCNNGVCNLVK